MKGTRRTVYCSVPSTEVEGFSRRGFLGASVAFALLAGCSEATVQLEERDWRPFFADLNKGGILIDTNARRLAHWTPGNTAYAEYPTGVPSSPELERRGRTQVVRKKVAPDWRPTLSMRQRNPALPNYVPPGPDNPLGDYALYLSWTYYAIHGTNDPATVGRPTTSGCFRLFDGHIARLYGATPIGTPVVVI